MPFWSRNRYSSGVDSYRYVEKLIRGGKEVYIVSPYIDAYYAALIRRYANWKRFYIISSSLDENAKKILESRGSWMGVGIFAVFVVFVSWILFALSLFSLDILILALAAILARVIVFKFSTRNRIRLKVPRSFVHAKMYISERMAISGSANLTYRGMHSNVEQIEVVYDQKAILDFKKRFWSMWDS